VELVELGLVDADGIYWNEDLNIAGFSAPRGAIAPSKLLQWQAQSLD
jgi:hypothetical protein